ncbi:MAG: N-acetylmuramoyl-L-alanine amidase [Massiliimalia sp.]|jgi:N-acetylmuramoyl-L-alanine amidase
MLSKWSMSRRRNLTAGKLTVLCMACVFAVCYAVLKPQPQEAVSLGVQKRTPSVVIDAGHGGADGGAVGVHGEIEKEINLAISKDLRDFLALCGFETTMTREDDRSIHDKDCDTLKEQKRSDIHNRAQIMEESKGAVAVSIHQNHFTDSRYGGAQMFYGVKNQESAVLAQFIQKSFVSRIQPENQRMIKEGPESVYLLQNVSCPIVLAECGFLSNEEESALLADETYQAEAAFAVFCGIVEYYNEE